MIYIQGGVFSLTTDDYSPCLQYSAAGVGVRGTLGERGLLTFTHTHTPLEPWMG